MVRVLSHREPALLITGRTISAFGDGVANVAFALMIITLAPHATRFEWLGFFAAARQVPFIMLLLFGGVAADRLSHRTILLASDLVRGLVTLVITVLLVTGELRLWMTLVFALIFGAFDAVFFPAMTAITPEIVPNDLLNAWNALRPMANQLVGTIIGPVVGGVLVAISTSLAIGVDAATFFISALAIFFMARTPARGTHENSSMISEIKEGFGFARRTTWLWATIVIAGVTNAVMFTPAYSLAPNFLKSDLHASALGIGLTLAAGGVAGLISLLIVGSRSIPIRRVRVMWLSWIISTLFVLAFGFANGVVVAALALALASPGLNYGNVIWESLMQSEVPERLLGRVSSVDWLMSLGLAPIGIVVASFIIGAIGMRNYLIGAAVLALIPSIWGLVSKKVNEVDEPRIAAKSQPIDVGGPGGHS